MEKVFIISIIITSIYCLIKFLEMKFIEKDMKPIKIVVRDAIIVMFCSIVSTYIYFNIDKNVVNFFNVITNNTVVEPSVTQVFTDQPGF